MVLVACLAGQALIANVHTAKAWDEVCSFSQNTSYLLAPAETWFE